MVNYPEVGYTPANLRAFLAHKKLTQKNAALFFGVSENTINQWCAPVGTKNHRDMPLKKWDMVAGS